MCFPPRPAVDLEHSLRQSPGYTREHVGAVVRARSPVQPPRETASPARGTLSSVRGGHVPEFCLRPGERSVWVTLLNTVIVTVVNISHPPKKFFLRYIFLIPFAALCFGMRTIKLHDVERTRSRETRPVATRSLTRAAALLT